MASLFATGPLVDSPWLGWLFVVASIASGVGVIIALSRRDGLKGNIPQFAVIACVFLFAALVLGPWGVFAPGIKTDAVAGTVKSQYDIIDVVPDDSPGDQPRASRFCQPLADDSPLFRGRADSHEITFRVSVSDCNADAPATSIKVIDSGGTEITSESLRKAQ